jgi:hypothetical protein
MLLGFNGLDEVICRRAGLPKSSQAHAREMFIFRFSEKYALLPQSRLGKRGGRVVTNAGRDAMDAGDITRRVMLNADGKSAWS